MLVRLGVRSVRFCFGGCGNCVAVVFAFDGVVYGTCGFIGGGKASFFRVAFGFFFLGLSDVFRQCRGFFRAQLRTQRVLRARFPPREFRVRGARPETQLMFMRLMWHGWSRCFDVLLDGSIAMLPFRKRFTRQRFEAGRKRSRRFRAGFRMEFAPGFECARRRRFVHLLGLFDDGSSSWRARCEVGWFVGDGDSRRVVGGSRNGFARRLFAIFREGLSGQNYRDVPFRRSRFARRTFKRAGRSVLG